MEWQVNDMRSTTPSPQATNELDYSTIIAWWLVVCQSCLRHCSINGNGSVTKCVIDQSKYWWWYRNWYWNVGNWVKWTHVASVNSYRFLKVINSPLHRPDGRQFACRQVWARRVWNSWDQTLSALCMQVCWYDVMNTIMYLLYEYSTRPKCWSSIVRYGVTINIAMMTRQVQMYNLCLALNSQKTCKYFLDLQTSVSCNMATYLNFFLIKNLYLLEGSNWVIKITFVFFLVVIISIMQITPFLTIKFILVHHI